MSVVLSAPAAPKESTVNIDGKVREFIVVAPRKQTKNPPLVFAFHGHGGNMNYAYRKFDFYKYWPEAVCVYMSGIPTKTTNDPAGNRNGWQQFPKTEGDKDLKFFDEVYRSIVKSYSVNTRQVFCMGHSNGGRMTFLLWAERPNLFAATAPASSGGRLLNLTPKPMFYVGSESDEIVSWRSQSATLDMVYKLNGTTTTVNKSRGPWKEFKSKVPTETFIHADGHRFPEETIPLMTKFFQSIAASPSPTKSRRAR